MYTDEEKAAIKALEAQIAELKAKARADKKQNPFQAITKAYEATGAYTCYNEFEEAVVIEYPGRKPKRLEDDDLVDIRLRILQEGSRAHPDSVHDFVVKEARKHSFHPVKEYLDSLHWDGIPRIDTWLRKYMAAKDAPHVNRVGAVTLIAGVRRVRRPGCKFDNAPVFISQEGSGKSSAIRLLSPNPDWYTDSLPISSDPKRVVEGSTGIWIVESAEMVGNKNVEMVKAFMSRQADGPVRMAYARLPQTRKRQFIVLGSTNEQKPLRSQTGNRRFWPIVTGCVYLDWLERDRDQLWAEAAAREAEDESIFLDEHLHPYVLDVQEKFVENDPWQDILEEKLEELRGQDKDMSLLPLSYIWDWLGVHPGSRHTEQSARITTLMRKLYYVKEKDRKFCKLNGKRCIVFRSIQNPFEPESLDTSQAGAPKEELDIPTPDDYIDD